MTCKDCIHYDACNKLNIMFGFPTTDLLGYEKLCGCFADKSRYIELPCKVGDMIYDIYNAALNGGSDISELKVPEIHINLDRRNKPWIIISGYYFAFEDFGKYTFFTKEEAEKALAERNNR